MNGLDGFRERRSGSPSASSLLVLSTCLISEAPDACDVYESTLRWSPCTSSGCQAATDTRQPERKEFRVERLAGQREPSSLDQSYPPSFILLRPTVPEPLGPVAETNTVSLEGVSLGPIGRDGRSRRRKQNFEFGLFSLDSKTPAVDAGAQPHPVSQRARGRAGGLTVPRRPYS